MFVAKTIGLWLLILVFAILNGTFREVVLLPMMGKPFALMLSGILLSVFIMMVAWIFVPRIVAAQRIKPMYIGLLWLTLTLMFEFVFGRWVQGRSWSELLQSYTFKDGNLWPLVLLVTLAAPVTAVRYAPKR